MAVGSAAHVIDWVAIGAIATFIGATATLVSAGIIAFQAFYTRKSVQDAEATLSLAQEQFARDALVFNEAQKARMDAEMPRLALAQARIGQATVWRWDPSGIQMNTSADDTFAPPADLNQMLAIELVVLVANHGPRQALCRVAAPLPDTWNDEVVFDVSSATSPEHPISVRINRSVGEWISYYRLDNDAWQHGRTRPYETALTIDYRFPGNFGADEHHEFVVSGSVLEPVPDSEDRWRVNRNARTFVTLREQPFRRTYYLNRITVQTIP